MINPSNIDIDLLHLITKNILDKKRPQLERKVGYTTAYLFLMLGDFWVSDQPANFLYIGKQPTEAYLNFIHLLIYHHGENSITGLYNIPDHKIITKKESTFKFVDLSRINKETFWHGTSYKCIFFDAFIDELNTEQQKELECNVYYTGATLL